MTKPCGNSVDLIDNIHEDLSIVRGVITLLEGAVAGADEYVGYDVFPVLGDTKEKIKRVKENSDALWEQLRAKLMAEKSENDTE